MVQIHGVFQPVLVHGQTWELRSVPTERLCWGRCVGARSSALLDETTAVAEGKEEYRLSNWGKKN